MKNVNKIIFKLLKKIGYFKRKNVLELLVLSDIIYSERIKNEALFLKKKLSQYFILICSTLLLFSLLNHTPIIVTLYFSILLLFTIYIIFIMDIEIDSKKTNKIIRKNAVKQLTNKLNIDIEDPEFKKFIKNYFFEIVNMNLSNKENIKLLNNWVENEDKLKEYKIKRLDKLILDIENEKNEEIDVIKKIKKEI